MTISEQDLARVAELARLRLDPATVPEVTRRIGNILDITLKELEKGEEQGEAAEEQDQEEADEEVEDDVMDAADYEVNYADDGDDFEIGRAHV